MADEDFSNGCQSKLDDIHALLKEMHPVIKIELPQMLSTVAGAQAVMASAAKSMAETNDRAEKRYEKLEDRLQAANDKASGKSQIPLLSHYIVLGGTIFITILVVLYVHNQTVDATLTSIKVGQTEIK